ncbi:hypothetical protein SEA_THUNDERCLAP_50 [Arthrobacter phage Thunderclap]|uniref:DUF3310 domain-containing protein n=9 Tax=Amigovirus amigo TaxID=1982100 RepID=A0A5J6TD66_9CAUD|nr:nucleotide kinase [Arthrobacter phage Amigo]ALY08495.1 hypothetical protein ANANSI_50 [Arthrobacter phage Anansi]ALY09109.1 hypothetical protein GORGEOUS_50 [Arthrobacter phage Gorgeous]ALY10390.1 hypothetical protein SORJUANA_50 [Arthrobacter phage SorJuana]QFG08344.1 hypothetical protein SEA_YEEZUS_50 [Arthrobacter phage Yeezus]QFG13392.1 hypothetical protein SEA_ICHOR_50 [Arthrobacter phage Ichor]QFG13910.1 hypothetical protein SEA_JAEK_50 [Arthrobacter phage Jaek]QJD51697.1 hypothetic
MAEKFSVGSYVRVKENPFLPEAVKDIWRGVEGVVVGREGHRHLIKVTVDPQGTANNNRVGSTYSLVNLELRDSEGEKATDTPELVEHPAHYGGDTTYEVIKVIEAWGLGFVLGNVVKYVARAGKKPNQPELLDLKKARDYLNKRIAQLEENE